jgi:hypothetical protein
MNNYYTYAYLREDGTPYYIGKGKEYRAHQRNKTDVKPPKDKSRILFLKQNLTEEEAFEHEVYMIAVFGRKDLGTGILHNRTNGGEGMGGFKQTEEHKRKIREACKKVAEQTKKKISEAKRGKSVSEETKRKISQTLKGRTLPQEIKEKISEANKGEKNYFYGKRLLGESNGFYGKTHSDESKKTLSKLHYRLFEFTKPDGEKIIIETNLKKFCRENNLDRNTMGKILHNKPGFKSHKGWTVKLLSTNN